VVATVMGTTAGMGTVATAVVTGTAVEMVMETAMGTTAEMGMVATATAVVTAASPNLYIL
jgi:hypothetical protein